MYKSLQPPLYFGNFFFWVGGPHPEVLRANSWKVCGTRWGARDRTLVRHVKGKCPICSTITPVPTGVFSPFFLYPLPPTPVLPSPYFRNILQNTLLALLKAFYSTSQQRPKKLNYKATKLGVYNIPKTILLPVSTSLYQCPQFPSCSNFFLKKYIYNLYILQKDTL